MLDYLISGPAEVVWRNLPQQLIDGFLLGAIYALLALGYTMVYGILKLINFAHGEVFMLGGFATLYAAKLMGFENQTRQGNLGVIILLLLVAMVTCGVIGLLVERFAYRPLRNQPRIASLITAIGLSLLFSFGGAMLLPGGSTKQSMPQNANPYQGNYEITLRSAPPETLSAMTSAQAALDSANQAYEAQKRAEGITSDFGSKGSEKLKALKAARQEAESALKGASDAVASAEYRLSAAKGQVVMLVTTIILMAGLWFLVMKTKTGRAMRAASHDFDAAQLMGVNLDRVIAFTFALGSVLAGAGAMMYVTFQGVSIDPYLGTIPGVKAFVAAVLGGIGNIPGAVVGGFVMAIAEGLVSWLGYSQYKDAVAFVILILVLLVRPAGLLGSNKVEKV